MWISAAFLVFVLAVNEVKSASEPINLGRRCPSGWEKFGIQCFKFFKESKTWAEAEQHCVEQGGNLASIHDAITHSFLKNLLKEQADFLPRTWIGAHDATQEFIWFWSDGSKFNYNDWHSGEPNNGEGAERCVEMGYGAEERWNDARCETRLNFICFRGARVSF